MSEWGEDQEGREKLLLKGGEQNMVYERVILKREAISETLNTRWYIFLGRHYNWSILFEL